MKTIEDLFEVEYQLRFRASCYGESKIDQNRKLLRSAALAYATVAAEVDRALSIMDSVGRSRLDDAVATAKDNK